jgi:hypothetical protein
VDQPGSSKFIGTLNDGTASVSMSRGFGADRGPHASVSAVDPPSGGGHGSTSAGIAGGLVGQATRFTLYMLAPLPALRPALMAEMNASMVEAVSAADPVEDAEAAQAERLPGPLRVFARSAVEPLPSLQAISTTSGARQLVGEAFDRLDWNRRGVVSYQTLTTELGLDEDTAEELFTRLEFAVSKSVTRRDIAAFAASTLRDWSNLSKTLENYSSVTDAVRIAVHSAWTVVVLVSALLIFNISILEVLIPISTVAVALSFALGEPIRQLVLSILLLAVYQPFEIGDRVKVSDGEPQYVHKIMLLGTWFRTFHNEMKFIVSHGECARCHAVLLCFVARQVSRVHSRLCMLRSPITSWPTASLRTIGAPSTAWRR